MYQFSAAARDRLLEPWEEFVGTVYDDKRAKVHGHYPVWDGGTVRGTLTIGWGHTDAAGAPKISQGMTVTREEADTILDRDLAPCIAAINRLLRVKVTQHQFDALVDTYYNCPSAAVAAIRLINAGRSDDVPAKLLQYVSSKGERMRGLVNRRNAEIAWFNSPDHVAPPPAPDPDVVFSPKGERNAPPKSTIQSKTVVAGGSIFTLGLAEAAKAFNELLAPVKEAKGSLDELGVFDIVGSATHDPKFLLCAAIVGLAGFVIWDRRHKLLVDHV